MVDAPHAIPGRRPAVEALRAGRPLRELLVDTRARGLEELLEQARGAGVAIRRCSATELDVAAGGVRHQGVVALGTPPKGVPLSELEGAPLVVVLDGITDPQNLGAIARSAEAAGAAGLVLRSRRAAGVTPAAEKAAAGALSWLPVSTVPNILRAIERLTTAGAWAVGLDGSAPEELWSAPLLDGNVVLVVGAEGEGLSRLVRDRVDVLLRIPMAGRMSSLNAGAAAAVALFEIARRHRAV